MNLVLSFLFFLISSDVMAANLMGDYLDQKYCCNGNAESSYDGFWSGPITWILLGLGFAIYWKAPNNFQFVAPLVLFSPFVGMFIETDQMSYAVVFSLGSVLLSYLTHKDRL